MNESSLTKVTWNAWLDCVALEIPRGDAVLILLEAMGGGVDASWLVLHGDEPMNAKVKTIADDLAEKRKGGMPLAYVLGHKYFYGREFWLGDEPGSVLIPRPETETVIDMVKKMRPGSAMDVGTGSGCIAITLALEMPSLDVAGVDISETALAVARENARRLGVSLVTASENGCGRHDARRREKPSLHLYRSDLMSSVSRDYDVVIANLPYVDRKWEWLDRKALNYEPADALFAEDHGLSLVKRLITQVTDKKIKHLFLESDPVQHKAIIEYAKSYQLAEKNGFWLHFCTD